MLASSHTPQTNDKKLKARLWLELLMVNRQIETELRSRFRQRLKSSLPRFDVMAALARYPDGLRMSELAGELLVANGNITALVERLVADGLVERANMPRDRRTVHVRLTPKGNAEFTRMRAVHDDWLHEILGHVPTADARTVLTLVSRFATAHEPTAATGL